MTDVVQGHLWKFAVGKQTAEGTPLTTMEYATPFYSGAVMPVESREFFQLVDGNAYYPAQYKSQASSAGTVQVQAFPGSIGRLLTAHLGTDVKTGAADPFTHTITFTPAGPQWLTVYTQRPLVGGSVEWDQHKDALVRAISLDWESGSPVKATCDIIGKTASVAMTAPTITTTEVVDTTGAFYHFTGATMLRDWDATPAASAIHDFQSCSIQMAYSNATFDWTDAINPIYRDLGRWSMAFAGSLVLPDWQAYKATFFGSKTAAAVPQSPTVVRGSIDFTFNVLAGGATRTMQIQCPAIEFTIDPPMPNVDGSGLIATLSGVLETTTTPVTAIVKNAVSTQY